MSNVVKIFQSKQGRRPHYVREWAEKRGKRQADLARDIGADKGMVSKWFNEEKTSTPSNKWLEVLAAYFETEVEALFRHPDEDWFAQFFAGRRQEEIERIKATIETAFPRNGKAS